MTTETTSLADWLLERIAEDEQAAHYALSRGDSDPVWGGWWLGHYQHYTRHDPARVLATCAAKRRIVLTCASILRMGGLSDVDEAAMLAERVLMELASVYADQPGWREEWAL